MFLQLAHTTLNVYRQTRKLTLESYKLTELFPQDEKFAMVQQIRRAALSAHLYLAEGAIKKVTKRKKKIF